MLNFTEKFQAPLRFQLPSGATTSILRKLLMMFALCSAGCNETHETTKFMAFFKIKGSSFFV